MTAITTELRSASLLTELATAGTELSSGLHSLSHLDTAYDWSKAGRIADALDLFRSAATRTQGVTDALATNLPRGAAEAVQLSAGGFRAVIDRPNVAVEDAIRAANSFRGTLNWVTPAVDATVQRMDLAARLTELESQAATVRATIADMARRAEALQVPDAHAVGVRAAAFAKSAVTSAGHLVPN